MVVRVGGAMTGFRRYVFVISASMALCLGAAACGGGQEPAAGPSSPPPVTVSAEPSTSSAEPVVRLGEASVVIVREYADGDRALVAYEFASGRTRELVPLSWDEDPAVSPDGTQVVVVRANGPARDEGSKLWLAKSGSHLVLIDLATREERSLTAVEPRTWVRDPKWNRADGRVYYLALAGQFQAQTALRRFDPSTEAIGLAPHGKGVSQFELESDGRHAWVYAPWKWPNGQRGGAWRLDLLTGQVRPHRYQQAISGELAWTVAGDRIAMTQNVEGGVLSVAPWPDGWSARPGDASPGHRLYPKKSQWPRYVTTFGDLGWQPDGSHVVLASRRGVVEDRRMYPTTFDRWYVSLIDRRTGERTDITPPGVADTTFDVWWPEGGG
jgi:hypothetical protein